MSYLREASQIIGLDTEAINNVAACFSSWMESDNSPFEICVNANGQKLFNFLQVRLGEYDQGWKMISDIGLRLRACACSEASCERTISAQRLLLTCHNLRSRDETIAARLKIIKGCEWINYKIGTLLYITFFFAFNGLVDKKVRGKSSPLGGRFRPYRDA